ncbi:MAG: creatininase family protein [Gemmatimonadales bacterium]
MRVLSLFDSSWCEIRDLDRSRTIALLPAGAIEAHGPHLPLGTDVIISEAMARTAAEQLAAIGYEPLILPALMYSAAQFGANFPGTISLDPDAVSATIRGIANSLAEHGIRVLAIANSHLDPLHIESLNVAAEQVRMETPMKVVFPDITRKPWASRLTEEFRSGACHAGQYETSVVLAERPELVQDKIRMDLTPNPSSLSAAIREGKTTFEEAGGHLAYFGRPADASPEEGRDTIETLGAILREAILETVTDMRNADGGG